MSEKLNSSDRSPDTSSQTGTAVRPPGVSGLSIYVPRPRVDLQAWCDWTGAKWDKVSAVVGNSFRMPAPHESLYTMAANAVARLIEQYDIDPERIGYLALGTESSTDNATGTAIVKGMLDRQLVSQGRAPVSRACEIPEFKQACLGGIYALKGALRYVATEGRDRVAIVVSADIAEYERGSSGEQTQGAGAVAMLVEADPKLFAVDLGRSGNAADYRGVDFRKPIARHSVPDYAARTKRMHDFPVFNGRYSTHCFVDATARAFRVLAERHGQSELSTLNEAAAIFMHRPYHRMPVQSLSTIFLWAIADDPGSADLLASVCAACEVEPEALKAEMRSAPSLLELINDEGFEADPYPLSNKVSGAVRKSAAFRALTKDKLSLGAPGCMDLGNLYTASLPAWLCSAFEAALTEGNDIAGASMLAIGYGSGDAAEALSLRVSPEWQAAAGRIKFADALANGVDISQSVYESLHDTGTAAELDIRPEGEFVVTGTGTAHGDGLQDVGIEYYAYAE